MPDFSHARTEHFRDLVAWRVTSPAGHVLREQLRARRADPDQYRLEL